MKNIHVAHNVPIRTGAQLSECFCILQLGDYRLSDYNSAIVTMRLNEPLTPHMDNTISY